MKKMKWKFFVFTLLICVMMSCDESSDTPSANSNLNAYFNIEGANYVQGKLPEASSSPDAPTIQSISGNASIINGGSNRVTILSADEYTKVIVGIKGLNTGYYEYPVELKSAYSCTFVLQIGTDLPQDEFLIIFALVDANGVIGAYNEIGVGRVETNFGVLQISCSWDLFNDIDLHVVNPRGEEVYYGDPGFDYDYIAIVNHYLDLNLDANTDLSKITLSAEQEAIIYNLSESDVKRFMLDTISGGNLDVDSNADCYVDSINNENIIYPTMADIVAGEYIVRVDFYSDCIGYGETNYTVLARLNGELLETTYSTNPYNGKFYAGEDDGGDYGDGVEIMRFTIAEAQLKSANIEHTYVFKYKNEGSFNANVLRGLQKRLK